MYIASKPCSFAGTAYRIGDEIPEDKILPEAVARLKRQGVIAEHGAGVLLPDPTSIGARRPSTVKLPILAATGDVEFEIELTPEALIRALTVAQADEAAIGEALDTLETEEEMIAADCFAKSEALRNELRARHAEAEQNRLMEKTRQELVEIATAEGIEVGSKDNKGEIVQAILDAQGSDE